LPAAGLFNWKLPFSVDKTVCKGAVLFFLKIRTVTNASGLLLSETVPDNLILVWENACTGRLNRTVATRAKSKILLMILVLAYRGIFKIKSNEIFRTSSIYLMKGRMRRMRGWKEECAVAGFYKGVVVMPTQPEPKDKRVVNLCFPPWRSQLRRLTTLVNL